MENEFKLTPCRPPEEPCDFECGSDDDITDKDLAVLLKEEAAKIYKNEAGNEKTNKYQDQDQDQDQNASKEGKERKSEYPKKRELDEGEGEQRGKKRPCRKVIKNPFFTNRLKFSSDLPPRPPFPPPQFFPLADEDSKPKVCPKKKKCKKKKVKSSADFDKDKDNDYDYDYDYDEDLKEKAGRPECEAEEENTGECTCDEEPPHRRICKKTKEKKVLPPCRKKASDISIPPQPRRIPAALKDLPSKCPKDIPEVERQIWMSHDNSLQRSACKKKCKKKETVEQLLNQ